MDILTSPESWIALATLTALEVVLGIDNIIFISILAGKLPEHQQARARTVGLAMAMLTRIGLLLSLTWIMRLTDPLFSVLGKEFSGKDLILLSGGCSWLPRARMRSMTSLRGPKNRSPGRAAKSFLGVIIMIMLLDIVFSLDSVITAVGMANQVVIMIAAVVIAVIFMMFFSGYISRFVDRHPTIKMLALVVLVADWCDACCGGFWSAHCEGVHLLCDGVFGVCGDVESPSAQGCQAGSASRPSGLTSFCFLHAAYGILRSEGNFTATSLHFCQDLGNF